MPESRAKRWLGSRLVVRNGREATVHDLPLAG